jgi:ABC-type transport system involved in multi-copper enzyme maturation permease subunit
LSPAAEIRLVALREVRRSIRSVKGIIVGVITLLGAFLTSLIGLWVESVIREKAGAGSTEAFIELKRQAIEKSTGNAALAAYYSSVPTALIIFLKFTIWFGPLLISLLGFDSVSSDLQHRSVRFWTVRVRRWSFYSGKLVGLWMVVGIVTLVLIALASTVTAIKGYVTIGQVLRWVPMFWLVAFVISGAWAAIATFISSCFRTPILALLTTFGTFFVMWIPGFIGFIARLVSPPSDELADVGNGMDWYDYLYPNSYDTLLLDPAASRTLVGFTILIAFIVIWTAGASFLFQRRDI